jgi:hypothetical protein
MSPKVLILATEVTLVKLSVWRLRELGMRILHVIKAEVLVLRDWLGRHLVSLNMRRGTTLRVLGLACLTRGLVR